MIPSFRFLNFIESCHGGQGYRQPVAVSTPGHDEQQLFHNEISPYIFFNTIITYVLYTYGDKNNY